MSTLVLRLKSTDSNCLLNPVLDDLRFCGQLRCLECFFSSSRGYCVPHWTVFAAS